MPFTVSFLCILCFLCIQLRSGSLNFLFPPILWRFTYPSFGNGPTTMLIQGENICWYMHLSFQLYFELIGSRDHFLIVFMCLVVRWYLAYIRVGLSYQLPENTWNLNSIIDFPQYHINYKSVKYAQTVETSQGHIKVS